jgi:ethanolamine-phosphate cytidylyltransferase
MDGAFDMMHFGHMNAFRQGRSLGTHLVVGVNRCSAKKFMSVIPASYCSVFFPFSDVTITQCKGAPVMNDDERVEAVKACKWVDEVVSGVPYVMVL